MHDAHMTQSPTIDPLASLTDLDASAEGRLLALDPWYVPARVETDHGWLVWDPDGPSRRVESNRTLLDRFAALAGASDRQLARFVTRWGPLERQRVGGDDEAPKPESLNPERLAVMYRPNLVPSHLRPLAARGRAWGEEMRARARWVVAALRLAKMLAEERPGDEADWQEIAPGRWRRSFDGPEPPPGEPWPAEWRPVAADFPGADDQRRYLAHHVSRALDEAGVRPRLAWRGEGFVFRLTTGGLAGAVAAELALRIGDLRAFGAPCSGGCGRWVSSRRWRSDAPMCKWCAQAKASRNYRARQKEEQR